MALSLRQIAFVARERDPIVAGLCAVLGTTVCCVDEAVQEFGLENAVMPVGTQFLEVVAPIRPGAPAARYLERRGGDAGYMVICQAANRAEQQGCRDRARALGIRVAWEKPHHDGHYLQFHPRDTGGCFFEIDTVHGDDPLGPWPPAGGLSDDNDSPVQAITAVEIAAREPEPVFARWRTIAGEHASVATSDDLELTLANASVRFTRCSAERDAGLVAITLACSDRAAIRAAAAARALVGADDALLIGGVRINLEELCPA